MERHVLLMCVTASFVALPGIQPQDNDTSILVKPSFARGGVGLAGVRRVWRAARNASSVNGGSLPYSLGTVANAA